MHWKMAENCAERRLVEGLLNRENCLDLLCDRFAPIVFAVAFHYSQRIDDAHMCVEPVLVRLCKRFTQQRLSSRDWESLLIDETVHWCDDRKSEQGEGVDEGDSGDSAIGLTSFAKLPRIARRRAITSVLGSLGLTDLIIMLLRFREPPLELSRIASLVDASESEVSAKLVAIDEALRGALLGTGADE